MKTSGLSRLGRISGIVMLTLLAGCQAATPLEVIQGIFGYIPPPEAQSIQQEMEQEYFRCKAGGGENCAQVAYDMIRVTRGLDPKPVPKGVIVILEGDEPSKSAKEEKNKDDGNQ